MKLFVALLAAAFLITAIASAKAESGFGEGFTSQSAQAFRDPIATDMNADMDSAAGSFNDISPAAGQEISTDDGRTLTQEPKTITVPQINFTEETSISE